MSTETETMEPVSEDSVTALYEIAYELYKNGKLTDAEHCFVLLTLLQPENIKFWMGLGACYEMQREYNKALECYTALAMHNPSDPNVHWRAANCLYAKGDEARALTALRSAITVASENEEHAEMLPSLKNFEELWSQKLNKIREKQE